MTRFKWIAAVATLFVLLGAVPVLADEGEETEGTEETTEEEASLTNSPLALLLSTEYGITLEEIEALGEAGLGFGEIFKLKTLSLVTGLSFDELLAGFEVDPETGEFDFDWGALKATFTEEQLAFLETLPKNFGQFVSANKRHHGRDEHQPEHATLKTNNKGGNGHNG